MLTFSTKQFCNVLFLSKELSHLESRVNKLLKSALHVEAITWIHVQYFRTIQIITVLCIVIFLLSFLIDVISVILLTSYFFVNSA